MESCLESCRCVGSHKGGSHWETQVTKRRKSGLVACSVEEFFRDHDLLPGEAEKEEEKKAMFFAKEKKAKKDHVENVKKIKKDDVEEMGGREVRTVHRMAGQAGPDVVHVSGKVRGKGTGCRSFGSVWIGFRIV